MASQNRVENESFIASVDLDSSQHYFVDLTAAAHKITVSAADGGIGVLQNKPLAGEHGTVSLRGQVKVHAGVAISIGDLISSAGSGFAAVHVASFQVASGSVLISKTILGEAMTAAASGSVFTMELNPRFTQVLSA